MLGSVPSTALQAQEEEEEAWVAEGVVRLMEAEAPVAP